MKRRVIGLGCVAFVVAVAACERRAPEDGGQAVAQAHALISDGAHRVGDAPGRDGFYFLPPMVGAPEVDGLFDPGLSPVVQICQLAGAGCVEPLLATYTRESGPGSETIQVSEADEHYVVQWHTDAFDLNTAATYRITVRAAGTELGFADVDVVDSGRELRNVATDEFIALKDGRTLPIKFRIEHDVVFPVGEAGGEVSALGGAVTLVLPPDAVDELGLTVEPAADELPPGHLGDAFEIGPSGTQFAVPVTVAIALDPTLLAGMNRARLRVATVVDGAWQALPPDPDFDGPENVIAGLTTHLSPFSVIELGTAVVAAGAWFTCAVGVDKQLTCWGRDVYGETSPPPGQYVQVDASVQGAHACALRDDGTAACWGYDEWGAATVPDPLETFTQLSAGGTFSCGLKSDATVRCWGRLPGEVPAPPASTTFSQISAGDSHVCGIRGSDAAVVCWGADYYAQSSGAPAGAFTHISSGSYRSCGVRVDGTLACWGRANSAPTPSGTFTEVEAGNGYHYSCAIRSDGEIVCWGLDLPAAMPPPGVHSALSLSNGAEEDGQTTHSCAVDSGGAIVCWGDNSYGQSTPPTSLGYRYPVTPPPAGGLPQVSAGAVHSCAVKFDNTLACWGSTRFHESCPPSGNYAQVVAGQGYGCARRTDDTVTCWGEGTPGGIPRAPAGAFDQIDGGTFHICGTRPDGSVECWGSGIFGSTEPPDGAFLQVSAGFQHSCGVRTDQTLSCWGHDSGEASPPAGAFTQVSAGISGSPIGAHSCGLRSDGTAACWGDNFQGKATPPAGTFMQVEAGGTHSCGLRPDGSIECWGDNSSGELDAPAGSFRQITAGVDHSCAVRDDDVVVCWGSSQEGKDDPSTPPMCTFG